MEFSELVKRGLQPSFGDVAEYILTVLAAKNYKRSELVAAVETGWRQAGAAQPMQGDQVARVKKALSTLKLQGRIESHGRGVYLIAGSPVRAREIITQTAPPEKEKIAAEILVGDGDGYVYGYYLPAYRKIAQENGADRWPIKIGMTVNPLHSRMAAHSTGLPEEPVLGIVIRSSHAALLEQTLHRVLAMRGRRTMSAAGDEWYDSTPDEINNIYQFVAGEVSA